MIFGSGIDGKIETEKAESRMAVDKLPRYERSEFERSTTYSERSELLKDQLPLKKFFFKIDNVILNIICVIVKGPAPKLEAGGRGVIGAGLISCRSISGSASQPANKART